MTPGVSQPSVAPPNPDLPPRRARVRAAWTQYSLWLIAGVALVGALKIAQQAVVPVLFAVFVTLLLSPAVEALARRRATGSKRRPPRCASSRPRSGP